MNTRFTTRAVCGHNVDALLRLKIAPEQERFVVPNAVIIAQAAFAPAAELLALCAGDEAVGLMSLLNMPLHDADMGVDGPRNGAFIWRLMVDARHQRRGYGGAALKVAVDWARARGLVRLNLTAGSGNGSPRPFYEANGFVGTGLVVDGEDVLQRIL